MARRATDLRTLRRALARRSVLQAGRGRWIQVGAVLVVALGIGLGLVASRLYHLATTGGCEPREPADLSVEEIGAVRARLDQYRVEPDPGAHLELGGREASFLLRDLVESRLWLQVAGDRVQAEIQRGPPDRCVTIRYRGGVEVREGVTVLEPEELVVGRADLSPYTRGRALRLPSRWVPDPGARVLLANLDSLRVSGGSLQLRFHDRWEIWR